MEPEDPPEDPLSALGVRYSSSGSRIGVYSAAATSIELCIFDDTDPNWLTQVVPLTRGDGDVWTAQTDALRIGTRYAFRASGAHSGRDAFRADTLLIDPYGRGLARTGAGSYRSNSFRSVVIDGDFDWGGVPKPGRPLDRTVVYESHVKGLSKLNPAVPEELRGTYAGLAHPASIDYLTTLGVTAVELLPVHAFVSEERLIKQGLANYWGYNTLNFFTPHPGYATKNAQARGADAILREFKGMVKLLHQAGLEVFLDVVYNHTSEEGVGGPTTSLRGLDNATYYRQDARGSYIDVTGCGNTVDASNPVARRLILDSLRYWANDVQVDGFRFDLAAALGRDEQCRFSPDSDMLYEILDDPSLNGVKRIAEPWDVGAGGWQTGNFPIGWSEWNDHYRDRARTFWLRDIADSRAHGEPSVGIGSFATRLAGSSTTFAATGGPLASLNFVTAHDGFTAWDLVSYNQKHNLGNGEDNRDGTDDNRSFNHGVEGSTTDPVVLAVRRKAVRNLMATLLFSAGVPMLTAGDEFGRTQNGNNNAYCHDDELTWLDWQWDDWQSDLLATTRRLIHLRDTNPALRPVRYGRSGESVPGASQMDWYDASGSTMDLQDWNSPENRTLQYLVASTPEFEAFNRVLVIVHGLESDVSVTLARHDGVGRYSLLWNSADETPASDGHDFEPGSTITVTATSVQLYRALPT